MNQLLTHLCILLPSGSGWTPGLGLEGTIEWSATLSPTSTKLACIKTVVLWIQSQYYLNYVQIRLDSPIIYNMHEKDYEQC